MAQFVRSNKTSPKGNPIDAHFTSSRPLCHFTILVCRAASVNAFWYKRQLARYHNHWLVQLDQIADLTALEQGCAGFYADSDRGALVTHPVPRLVRALLVKYLYNLSLRLTEELIDLSRIGSSDCVACWAIGEPGRFPERTSPASWTGSLGLT